MRIVVKGRNTSVDEALRERVERRFEIVARQVSSLAELDVELRGEREPTPCVAEATLRLKGVTLRACERSRDMEHAVHECADDLARQVKRDRDKRRRRREARSSRDVSPSP